MISSALQREFFFDVSEKTQELKLLFLNKFKIRLSEDTRLLNICLSDGSLVRCQRTLTRFFFFLFVHGRE